jgi:hypothetical protein
MFFLYSLISGCSLGSFGKNCVHNCSDNCGDVPMVCNGRTGECTGGCRPGWEGLQCNIGKCSNICLLGNHINYFSNLSLSSK